MTAQSVAEVVALVRPQLHAVAYRLLGSVAEAEDAVQEACLQLEQHGLDGIDNPEAWLMRVTSRRALDRLRSAQVRREQYVGPWLPEPLLVSDDVADDVEQAESVSMAFLLVLESLSPAERVAFVMHDVFGYGYDDLAVILDRSEQSCRQLVSRARKSVQARRPRFDADRKQRDQVVERFLEACLSGDVDGLLEVLAPDVILQSDGGGVASAARRPVEGAEHVARFFLGILKQVPPDLSVQLERVNGTLGIVGRRPDGTADTAFAIEVRDGRIGAIYGLRNPEKLGHLKT
jgi:RNA polymerase sigma-70 factor (ECF subfamily)